MGRKVCLGMGNVLLSLALINAVGAVPPPRPAAEVWVEGETAQEHNFPSKGGGVVETFIGDPQARLDRAYGRRALRLQTSEEPRTGEYYAVYEVTVPQAGRYEILLAGSQLRAHWASPAWLTLDQGPPLFLGAIPAQGKPWAPSSARPQQAIFAWHSLGVHELAAGRHRLRFSLRERGSTGDYLWWIDALALCNRSPEAALTFAADFEGTVEPTFAAGEGTPAVEGPVEFAPGRRGQAVKLERGVVLRYPARDNLSLNAGTVMLWFNFLSPPTNRPYWDRLFDMTFGEGNRDALRIVLSQRIGYLYAVCNSSAEGEEKRYGPPAATPILAPGEWHHVALTWGPRGCAFYLDGHLLGQSGNYVPPRGLDEWFYVGNDKTKKGPIDALVDEVRLYRRPLSLRDIREAAGLPVPRPRGNLVRNGGFELGQWGWKVLQGGPIGGRWEPVKGGIEGESCLLIDTTEANPHGGAVVNLFGPWQMLVPGEFYTLSVFLKADGENVPVRLRIQNGVIHQLLEIGAVTLVGLAYPVRVGPAWRQYVVAGPLPAAYKNAYRAHISVPAGHRVWVDAVRFAAGGLRNDVPTQEPTLAVGLNVPANLYSEGQPVTARVQVLNPGREPRRGRLFYTLTDYREMTVREGEKPLSVKAGQRAEELLSLGVLPQRGTYRLTVRWVAASGQEWAQDTAQLAVIRDLSGQVSPPSPFAVHEGEHLSVILPLLRRVGCVALRNAARTRWFTVEPRRGQFIWQDEFHDRLRAEGLSLLGLLGFAPPWAREVLPGVHWLSARVPPRRLEEWGQYVYETVRHYRDRIQWWEVWNEPNVRRFFSGTPEQYADLLRVAYQQAKRANPNCYILGCSLAGLDDRALEFAERVFAAGGLNYLDAVSFHPYQNSPPEEGMPERIERLRALMRQYGREVDLVNTEVGWEGTDFYDPAVPYFSHPWVVPPWGELTQATVLVRSYVLNLALGVKRYYWYKWLEERGSVGPDLHGLMRDDWCFSPKAGLVAYNALVERLHEAQFIRRVEVGEEQVHLYEFARPGKRVFVLWTVGEPKVVSLPGRGGKMRLYDLMGNLITTLSNGQYRATDEPVYIVVEGE
ncbi:MAG TPA: hypothetical protein EYP85_09030 [Armatimonadetes bacterium]|nr:hypothetical protein [Armatimonadota bacterium]